MARHGMRKGLSKKSKSSLNQAGSKVAGGANGASSTPRATTAGAKSKAGASSSSLSSKFTPSSSSITPATAPPINYDIIEAMERPAKLVQLDRQLKITKTSTASLGKYDNKLKGEALREKGKKRQFESNEIKDSESERAKYMDILGRLDEEEIKKRRKEGAALERTNELVNVRKAIRGASRGRGSANLAGSEKKGSRSGGGSSRGGKGRKGK